MTHTVPNDLFEAHIDHLITAGVAPTQGTSLGIRLASYSLMNYIV
jgi:hypothetical protein